MTNAGGLGTTERETKARRTGPGLRVQILLALAGVILVAYVPLFFAIAQVARATSLSYREESARALGRAVAAHTSDLVRVDPTGVSRMLTSHVGDGGALAIAVYDREGHVFASAGEGPELAALHAPSKPYGEATTRTRTRTGKRSLDVVLPAGEGAVLVRVRTEEDAARTAGLVRGIALYMGVFALALLVFAYIALTRAIVKPIEQLARAADQVASGARSFALPPSAAREIGDLGASVRSMATRLRAEEQAMRAKVEELTATTRRLGETREQLAGSERMASVGRLAAGVAHEIGNPIAAIMGMHELLDDIEIDGADRADFLRRMRKETERIHVVVRDLLDYARPEDGPTSGPGASADVSEIVNDALGLVRPQKEWRGVDVRVDVDSKLRAPVSPQRLTQVILNLLLNAGAALSDRQGEKRIAIRAKEDGGKLRLEIEDNGPGVPEALRGRIFDPFVTTKDVGAGTGLGLAVCRGIIEGANGRIYVDASFTSGARFVIELPLPMAPRLP